MIFVLLPLTATIYYLFNIASDQYASRIGFSVRSEDLTTPASLLGSLSSISGSSSSDTDILYEFIQSQTMVERMNERLDLAEIFSRPEYDPIFAYDPSGTIEDLADYWRRMVKVGHASSAGLLEVEVRAFRPEDARDIAVGIIEESTRMINELSDIARADATRSAIEDVNLALERLKVARENLTRFRSKTRIIDPIADLQSQMGLLGSLEAQLAEAQISLNLLRKNSNESDPRIAQAQRRIKVIRELIEQERAKFSSGSDAGGDGEDYSTLVAEFERLSVEVEYAQKAYLAAQVALDTARAEAQRQSRYLAIFAAPSLPQSPRYPQRILLSVVTGVFLLLGWFIGVLVYYSIRDRR